MVSSFHSEQSLFKLYILSTVSAMERRFVCSLVPMACAVFGCMKKQVTKGWVGLGTKLICMISVATYIHKLP